MNLYATDKEYKERFDYFLEEVKNDEGNKLDEPTRYLAVLSVLMGNQGICAYEEVLEKALDVLNFKKSSGEEIIQPQNVGWENGTRKILAANDKFRLEVLEFGGETSIPCPSKEKVFHGV